MEDNDLRVMKEEASRERERETQLDADMQKYEVTVTITRVETWEVEAANKEDAAINYEDGELLTGETDKQINAVETHGEI